MNRVPAGEHSGASALNMLVAFSSQALAATLAGLGYARFGYPPVMALAAGGAMLSGLLSRKLLRGLTEPPARSRPGCPAGSAPG